MGTKGGISFEEARNMPSYKKQIIIEELNNIISEQEKAAKGK